MIDVRPVSYVIALLVAALGVTMLIPAGVDFLYGNGHGGVFLQSAAVTFLVGLFVALATHNVNRGGLSLQETFLLTTSVWVALPIFGAIPFLIGSTAATPTDAFFEAMSGLTTTGATVFSGLDDMPEGLLVWRAILQWLGGVGIIVVAMVFLPELRVGGMQIFRSEGFDTMGKILPRAAQIAQQISVIYVALTVLCAGAYALAGLSFFDAVLHALTTVSTGGFSTRDASFGAFGAFAQFICIFFMILAALPFVRFVQLVNGEPQPLFKDRQVHGLLTVLGAVTLSVTIWIWLRSDVVSFEAFRAALFNATSLITGTGYASADYMQWGSFAIVALFFIGLVGGCAGSTSCSVKIFRYQLLFASVRAQVRQIYSPSGVFTPRYEGRPVGQDVVDSVMSFFVVFIAALVLLAVLLSMTGLDVITSVSGAAAALANIGPGLGSEIGPSEDYGSLNDTAKWLLSFGMLLGRLELMAVLVLFTRAFWNS
ncbi:MAG: TrkH family potassium uptake protein [Rhodobacteraceae bacterium]|nr:TrkH family potassium uptake protein [Paracoccaceae bacterium]